MGKFSFQEIDAGVVQVKAGAVSVIQIDDPIHDGALTAVYRRRHWWKLALLHARTRNRTLRKPHNGL